MPVSSLGGPVMSVGQDLFIASSVQYHPLGTQVRTADGRKFRYAAVEPSATTVTGQTAGASLVAGNLIQASAQVANHLARTASTAAIGAVSITSALGGTAGYVNQYAEGFAMISASTGLGIMYAVSSHASVAASGTVTLNLADPIVVATVTATSKIDLSQNPWKSVIQAPITTGTGVCVGLAPWALPALTVGAATGQNYGWLQTHGVSCCLITGTPAVGAMVVSVGAAAGAAAIASSTLQVVGMVMTTGTDAKTTAVFLTID